MNKKQVYKKYGIEYDTKTQKILSPIGWINPLLKNGNTKLGKAVWTWSMLPTNRKYTHIINGQEVIIDGTCPCHCKGCYATKGNYNFPSCVESLATKTWLARNCMAFVENAIMAQIQADGIKLCRIHASGDFFSVEYIDMWKRICKAFPNTAFWTYTKNSFAESAFDGIENINVVKSIIKGFGFNFGHCGYIMQVYKALQEKGIPVYICRCGIDKNQHCTNCKGCSKNEFVLFIEHSTDYKAESDPLFPALRDLIESQAKPI